MSSDASPLVRRLPTLLAEAVSVVFAVLVALAVDEYWEEREYVQEAEHTVEAIAREIRENRQELRGGDGPDLAATLAALDTAIATARAGERVRNFSVNWELALLSSAAWETAQTTRATQYIDLEEVIQLAQVYELQRLYSRSEDDLSDFIVTIATGMETDPAATLIELRGRLAHAAGIRRTLSTVYACTLVRIEGPDVVEPGACPESAPRDSI